MELKMKRFMIAAALILTQMAMAEVMVDYDFSGEVPAARGKLPMARFNDHITISGEPGQRSIVFDGKKSSGIIPSSKNVNMMKGGTVVMTLKCEDKEDGKNYHLFMMKKDEWLIGYSGSEFYFNFFTERRWNQGLKCRLDLSRTRTVGFSVTDEGKYLLFVDGKKVREGVFGISTPPLFNDSPVQIGAGWGGWSFKGEIGGMIIHNEALTDKQLMEATERK